MLDVVPMLGESVLGKLTKFVTAKSRGDYVL